MSDNINYVERYLERNPSTIPRDLFLTFYGGKDGPWLLERYQNGKVVPIRLNTWAKEEIIKQQFQPKKEEVWR